MSTSAHATSPMSEKPPHEAMGSGTATLDAGKGPGGAGGPSGRPKLEKFAYDFWAPQLAPLRKIVFKIMFGATMLLIIVMWLCLPFYWGSLWLSNVYTDKLTVRIIDRDMDALGSFVKNQLMSHSNLGYFESSASEFPTDASVEENVVDEGCWAAVVIQSGATSNLTIARQNGLSNWNGSNAITVYYSQARQETATGSYLVPYLQAALAQITGQYSAQSVGQYMGQNSGNATAMALLARAPTTISAPVSFSLVNLRPYNQPVATAITLVGLIYMLIFAFIITMAGAGAREIIAPYLKTRSLLMYRLAQPLILYLPVSFLFAMVSLPFKVHFDAHYTYAGGFFLWAFILYIGMASVGLATEFAVTIIGPKFTGYFLVPLIIANVSVASLPHELQPWIYRYGVAMPFYNVGKAVRTIIFDTRNEIGMNIGIIIAWVAVSCITIPLATWLFRRKAVNAHRKEQGENELDMGETGATSTVGGDARSEATH